MTVGSTGTEVVAAINYMSNIASCSNRLSLRSQIFSTAWISKLANAICDAKGDIELLVELSTAYFESH